MLHTSSIIHVALATKMTRWTGMGGIWAQDKGVWWGKNKLYSYGGGEITNAKFQYTYSKFVMVKKIRVLDTEEHRWS